jgi:hypothetical protein
MDHHISSQDLEAFAAGDLPKERARVLFSHLLGGCEICQRKAAALWHLDGRAESVPQNAYDRAMDRAVAAVEREILLSQVSLAA